MNTQDILNQASSTLANLVDHGVDIITISKPTSTQVALNLSKIVSKLSPLVGNLIKYHIVDILNQQQIFKEVGTWIRQDPGFPDTVFASSISPPPGIEVKCWYPLATEITARFKDSQNSLQQQNINIALIAWLPEYLIYGKPKIINVTVIPARSVAKARDEQYHKPPGYIILELEDTAERTSNLQQTNVNGFKWQGSQKDLIYASTIIRNWGINTEVYQPTREYQQLLRSLIAQYPYRLDTNFAKLDRIMHPDIELFKQTVYHTTLHKYTIAELNKFIWWWKVP